MKPISTPVADIFFEHDIWNLMYKAQARVTLEDAKLIVEKVIEQDCSPLLLIDIRELATIDKKARRYYASEKRTVAIAVLIENAVSRVIGNIFMGLSRPDYPVQLFTSKTEAINWLRGFVNVSK